MLIAESAAAVTLLVASYTAYNYRLTKRYRAGRGIAGSASAKLSEADNKLSAIKAAIKDKHAEVGGVHESLDDLHASLGS